MLAATVYGGWRALDVTRARVVPCPGMGYTPAMDPEAVRAFRDRDRAGVAQLKREYHAQRVHGADPGAGFRLSQQLRDHVRALIPGWPTRADRDEDLAHHLELKSRLDRAAGGFTGR